MDTTRVQKAFDNFYRDVVSVTSESIVDGNITLSYAKVLVEAFLFGVQASLTPEEYEYFKQLQDQKSESERANPNYVDIPESTLDFIFG